MRAAPAILTCFVTLFVAALLVNRLVLLDFPNSADEFAYLWQAQALVEGRLTAPAPIPHESFRSFHLGEADGLRFSRFPPGWPLLLSVGLALGQPGLVNPLLSALTLVGLLWLGERWVGRHAARLGVLLVAFSPFFLLNAGSYHSHPACLFCLTLLALSLEKAGDRPDRTLWWWLAGSSLGWAVLIRPFTGLLVGGLLLAVTGLTLVGRLEPSVRLRTVARAALNILVGGMPTMLILGFFNHYITGDWDTLPTTRLDPDEGLGFGHHGHTLQQGLQNTLVWGIEALAYTFFLSPLLVLYTGLRSRFRPRWLWILLLAPVLGYLFYWNPGGNRYGPRFYFEGLLAFAPLAGLGLMRVLEFRRLRWMLVVVGLTGLLMLGKLCVDAHDLVFARTAVFRAVEAAQLDQAIVLLEGDSADMPSYDLTRNPPRFERAPVLYARASGDADTQVAEIYPSRRIYYYRWDAQGGTLEPATSLRPAPARAPEVAAPEPTRSPTPDRP